jgi:hypothetical protein
MELRTTERIEAYPRNPVLHLSAQNTVFENENVEDAKHFSVQTALSPVLSLHRCLGRLGEPFIHFFLVGEQLLDARSFLHSLEMRRDVGEV